MDCSLQLNLSRRYVGEQGIGGYSVYVLVVGLVTWRGNSQSFVVVVVVLNVVGGGGFAGRVLCYDKTDVWWWRH